MSTVVRASSDHTPIIEIHRQSDTHALVGCPTKKASDRPTSHISRQASVSIPDLFDAIRTELGAIVIDKADLPEVTLQGGRGDLPWYAIGDRHSRPVRHGEDASTIRAEGMRAIALAEHLEASPPVDFTKVKALADVLEDLNGFSDADTIALATRLLATGRIDIKDPS